MKASTKRVEYECSRITVDTTGMHPMSVRVLIAGIEKWVDGAEAHPGNPFEIAEKEGKSIKRHKAEEIIDLFWYELVDAMESE